ncbi:hypothetical protein ACLB2K_021016 [Fragaria x ananassa]
MSKSYVTKTSCKSLTRIQGDHHHFTVHGLSIREATIYDLQLAFKQNQLTSRQLVQFYLKEIRRLNPVLNGVIEVNLDTINQADKADYQRKAKAPGYYSGLHGIPVLLKNNIGTRDKLNTTAGSFALLGSVLPRDASVVTKLRSAGAIILGKASLSEWAQFRSLTAPPGSSPRGGQGKNPYVLSASSCGSSSEPAISVAANLVAVSLGTETDGSILCPASFNSVVGIKPTVGLTSRAGVIPVTPRQDTIGPICRTVTDAVYVLDAIVGYDYKDLATKEASKYIPSGGYKQFAGAYGLKGKRLGIVRNPFFTSGSGSLQIQAFEQHFQTLRLDALVTPGADVAPVLAIGGFPGISAPAGYDNKGVPFGITFGGLKGSEPKLIQIAYGFEQATKIRKPPTFLP